MGDDAPERVAIVGSRLKYWQQPEAERVRAIVRSVVLSLPAGSVVVSGDEPTGVDRWAREAAQERGLDVVTWSAEWRRFGNAAGPMRNRQVAQDCHRMVALPSPDPRARGTHDAIRQARALGKPVTVLRP